MRTEPHSRTVPFTSGQSFDAQGGFHGCLGRHLPAEGEILDLGCGDHRELARYRTASRAVWGTDFHAHPDLDARRWFRRLPPDGTILFESDRFDAVAAAWVLEHVTDPAGFLSEVARVLKPGGHFVALTPHAWHYATWLIRAVGRLPHRVTQGIVERLYGRAERDTFPTVYRLNTRGRLTTAARAAGLEVTELVAFANPDYFRFARSARRAAIVTDRFLDHLAFGLGRLYLVAVLRKPAGTVSLTRMSAA